MPSENTKCLCSVELIATESGEAIYLRHQVAGTKELFRHNVDVYRITYQTHDVDGSVITASGAILVPEMAGPAPMMCYLRGTIIPVHWERRAPSYYDLENNQSIYENYEMSYLAAGFAAAGYVTVAPDLIGYGASRDREHPYLHSPSLAWAARDMLLPARELAARLRIELDDRLFISGWSEGGLAGMALHELLEREHADELAVRGSSLFAGTYALWAGMEWFCTLDQPYPEQQIYYWMFRSMNRVHGIGRPFEQIVRPEFAAGLAKDVMAPVPISPRDGLNPQFRARMRKRAEPDFRRAFEDSDRYDWKPIAPVFLHHGTHDDDAPFFHSQMAYQALRARGGDVTLYTYLGMDHYQPVHSYVIRTLADFSRRKEEAHERPIS